MFSRVAIRNLKVARRFSTVAPRVWDKFDNFVKERPVLAKCMVGGVLAFIADLVTQVGLSDAVSKKKYDEITIDWLRVLKFSAIGGLFVPPILHCWYGFLVARIPGVTVSSVLKRLALDQLCFAPVFLPCFISVAMFLDGKADQIPAKLKADWFPTVVANYSVWVPCQFINFRYVAPHQQVLFANAVSFFWNIYLSYTCYDNSDKATDAVAAVQAVVNAPTTSSTTAKAVQVIADEVSVAKAKEDLSPPPASEPVNEVAAVVMQSVTAVEEEPKEASAVIELKEDDQSIDRAGVAPVEFVEATMPPEVSVEMSEEDAKGQTVMLGGEEVVCEKVTVYAMDVEEVDDSEVMEIEIVEAKEEEEK